MWTDYCNHNISCGLVFKSTYAFVCTLTCLEHNLWQMIMYLVGPSIDCYEIVIIILTPEEVSLSYIFAITFLHMSKSRTKFIVLEHEGLIF